MRHLFIGSALCFVLVGTPLAQQPAQQRPSTGPGAMDMKACKDAMARHDQMMKEMQTADARLQEQVKAMNAAQGQAKVDALARVVTTMTEQRVQMHQRATAMHEQMMAHMMSHMGQRIHHAAVPMMQHMMKGDAQHRQ